MVWLVFVLFFDVSIGQSALVPLLPHFVDTFSLSGVQAGALISAVSFAMIVVAVPVGFLSDRFGARRLTLAATCVIVVASLGQGFATAFWMLLLARIVYGFGHATMWTGALAWLADLAPPGRRSRVVGASVPISGLGFAVGPLFAGVTAQHLAIWVPFVVVAAIAAALVPAFARGEDRAAGGHERPEFRHAFRATMAEPHARTGLLINVLTAVTFGSGVALLVPLELGRHGVSASGIGAVFTAAGAVGVAAGFAVARLGDRAATIKVAIFGTAAAAATVLIPLASLNKAALVLFVVLTGLTSSLLATICYPLALRGAHAAGIGQGSVVGISNLCFGVAAALGPVICGALIGASGVRAGFVFVLACGVATLAALLAWRR
jgi:MFS family permease